MAEKRELPAEIEVEKKLLAAMMLKDCSIIPEIANDLTDEDFYRVEHRVIFRTIIKIYNEGTPPNPVLIGDRLEKDGESSRVSRVYLFSIIDAEYTTARASAYVKIIKEKAFFRKVINSCEKIIEAAYDPAHDAEYVLDLFETKFLEVTLRNGNNAGFEPLSVIAQRSLKRIQYLQSHPEEVNGVTTGLADLDKVLNGLHKSDLILLAARPSMGKTALALNMAANAAKEKEIVAIFSLEMSKDQLGNRFLSTASQVNSMYLNTGNISESDMSKMIDSVEYMNNVNIFIDDTPGLSIIDIRSRVRKIRHEHGLSLVVIDYLQLMQGTRSKYSEQNRQQEISEISRNLKAMAREFNVPILALSQLSRNVEMRAEKKPQLSDLRESGSLEQDADIVMFLYRDEYYNRDDSDNQNIAELIIAKNRNGPTTSIRLQFNKDILRFGDLTRVEM